MGIAQRRRTWAATATTALATTALALGSLAGCGGSAPQMPVVVDLDDLSTPYPCGFGFQAGNDTSTVAIFLQPETSSSSLGGESVTLGDDSTWSGEIQVGRDLFANWCDDVWDDPSAEVDQRWELVDGVVTATETDGTATLTATDLVAVDPRGIRHELGDIVLVNTDWGMLAG